MTPPTPLETLPLDTLSAIRARRTVDLPLLSPDPIDDQTLSTLLEAANWAPNHGRTEPWRFAVFTGGGRTRLADALAESLALSQGRAEPTPEARETQRERQRMAPVWIVVAAQPAEKPRMPLYEEQWAAACAVQNLLLAARALGLGSKWISNVPSMHPHTARALGFSEDSTPLGMLYLGHVAGEWPAGKRGPAQDKVRWFRD